MSILRNIFLVSLLSSIPQCSDSENNDDSNSSTDMNNTDQYEIAEMIEPFAAKNTADDYIVFYGIEIPNDAPNLELKSVTFTNKSGSEQIKIIEKPINILHDSIIQEPKIPEGENGNIEVSINGEKKSISFSITLNSISFVKHYIIFTLEENSENIQELVFDLNEWCKKRYTDTNSLKCIQALE